MTELPHNLDKYLNSDFIWPRQTGTFWWQWSRERSGVNNLRVVAKLYNRNSGQSINSSNYLIDLIATFFSQMSITFTSFSQMWITLTYYQLLSLSQTLKFKLFFKYVTMHSKRKYQEYHFSDYFDRNPELIFSQMSISCTFHSPSFFLFLKRCL